VIVPHSNTNSGSYSFDMKKFCFLLLCSCFYAFSISSVTSAQAQQLLQQIDYLDLSSNADQVTFKLNGPYIPNVFTIKGEKPRIVLDFSDVTYTSSVQNITTVAGPLIDRIRVGLHKGDDPKTRVVLDLTTDQEIFFDKYFDEATSSLRFTVSTTSFATRELPPSSVQSDINQAHPSPSEPAPQPGQKEAQKEPVTASPGPQKEVAIAAESLKPAVTPLLREVSFDNSSNRGEMVLFKLNGFYPPIVKGVEEGSPKAICDFKNTQLSSEVQNIEHPEGRFVRSVRIGKHESPEKIRVVIDLEPNNNYDLQQVFFREDNLFVIIVNTISTAP